jgi:hypothetical protein
MTIPVRQAVLERIDASKAFAENQRLQALRAIHRDRIIGVALDLLEVEALQACKNFTTSAYSFIAGSANISMEGFGEDYSARATYIRDIIAEIRQALHSSAR